MAVNYKIADIFFLILIWINASSFAESQQVNRNSQEKFEESPEHVLPRTSWMEKFMPTKNFASHKYTTVSAQRRTGVSLNSSATWLDALKQKAIYNVSETLLKSFETHNPTHGLKKPKLIDIVSPSLPIDGSLREKSKNAVVKLRNAEPHRLRQTNVSDAWSWHDVQREFAECSPGMPGPRPDKYMVWTSTSALGNGLNIFAHAFVFALVSGRQLVVGSGTVPTLLCGPHGAFHCGLPTVQDVWGTDKAYKKQNPQTTYRWNREVAKDPRAVYESAVKWYQYGGVSHVL